VTTLDDVLASVSRLAGASVLWIGRGRFSGPGVGALLVHRVETNAWELPSADDIDVANAVAFGGYLFASCEQFAPAPTKRHDDFMWLDPTFALSAALPPGAAAALKQFTADSGAHHDGDLTMDYSQKDLTDLQSRCDRVCQACGGSAPRPMQGESSLGYHQRLIGLHQPHSKKFKDVDLSKVGDRSALETIESEVYESALADLESGADVPKGQMRAVVRNDASGRPITKYISSDPNVCWNQFAPPIRHVRRILTPGTAPA
jgi:hypothetical protein